MLEFLLCSLVTIFPDYLFRRFAQGKRWGKELNFYTMWFELRWGLTACLLLTVALITVIFYYHPSTKTATPFFRTLTILPEVNGRVDEVFVENLQLVQAGDPLFTLVDDTQLAAVDTARSLVTEIEAQMVSAEASILRAAAKVESAKAELAQNRTELKRRLDAQAINPGLISRDEIDTFTNRVAASEGALAAAEAELVSSQTQLNEILPAQRDSALASLKQAEVEQGRTTVHAGVTGRLAQFVLQPGDYLARVGRPAGLLIPTESHLGSGRNIVQAGFNQLVGPIIKPGTLAEMTCLSKPFTVIPMVVTAVSDVIAAGQIRPTDALLDVQDRGRPGTITVLLEPLYANGMEGVKPGTKCIANAYTNNHELLAEGNLGFGQSLFLHMVDTVGVVHGIILRIQATMLPVQMLVFAGH